MGLDIHGWIEITYASDGEARGRNDEIERVVVPAASRELHVRREANVVELQPRCDVLEEQAGDHRNGQVEQIVHRQNRLNEIVLSERKILRRCFDEQCVAIPPNTETVERRS